jgi:TMEM175 potassium channel family protein
VALLMPGIAYYLLQKAITRTHGTASTLAKALGSDIKGKISLLFYIAAILLALASPWISLALYTLVALIWLIPDRRIEHAVRQV